MNTILATVTPEDLLRMEDEGKGYELVSGEPRELAVSKESSYVAGKIHYRIQQHCEARRPGWVFPEGTSYRCFPHDEDRVRRPDTSFIRLDRMTAEQYYEDGYCTIVPDLAVEVVSPNDNAEEVEEKNEDWLTAGVKVLLVVYPNLRLIRALRQAPPRWFSAPPTRSSCRRCCLSSPARSPSFSASQRPPPRVDRTSCRFLGCIQQLLPTSPGPDFLVRRRRSYHSPGLRVFELPWVTRHLFFYPERVVIAITTPFRVEDKNKRKPRVARRLATLGYGKNAFGVQDGKGRCGKWRLW